MRIGPTELLGRIVDKIASLNALLIVTYRPEFAPSWIGRPHVTALTLNRLGKREIRAMIDSVAGNESLSSRVRQEIIERTDGVPLFVVYGWFTEGFDTRDLKEAKAMLEQLAT